MLAMNSGVSEKTVIGFLPQFHRIVGRRILPMAYSLLKDSFN